LKKFFSFLVQSWDIASIDTGKTGTIMAQYVQDLSPDQRRAFAKQLEFFLCNSETIAFLLDPLDAAREIQRLIAAFSIGQSAQASAALVERAAPENKDLVAKLVRAIQASYQV
jgi:hypothetical protein